MSGHGYSCNVYVYVYVCVYVVRNVGFYRGGSGEGGCKGANISGYCLWILANVFYLVPRICMGAIGMFGVDREIYTQFVSP